jgi:hypothetical protein
MFEAIKFGIYDFLKIIFLLFIISSVVGFLRTYLSKRKIKETLVLKSGFKGHFIASILGAATPFSSESFNLFANFLESGVPLGITFSFLVTTPIINEYVTILMLVFFGWKITLIYLVSGILIGTFVGLILSKLNLEKYILKKLVKKEILVGGKCSNKNKLKKGLNEGLAIIKKLWFWIFLGILVKIFIQFYISEQVISSLVENLGFLGVPIAILLGAPFPGSGAAIIPIALALFEKGIPLGTAFGFLIALISLSIPRIKELKKIMNTKLIFLFFMIIIFSIAFISYFLNFLIY